MNRQIIFNWLTILIFVSANIWGNEKKDQVSLDPSLWRTDFNKATRQAVAAGKPLCLLFYRHGVKSSTEFILELQASSAAREAMGGFVCIAINEWDLDNQELATNFHIELTPQIILLSPRGMEQGRFADPINVVDLASIMRRLGNKKITVTPTSPAASEKEMPAGLQRLTFEDASPIDHAQARLPNIGGGVVYDFVLGNPEDEQKSGVVLDGWGAPEQKGGLFCRNTDQTGVGDGTGGFATLSIPIKDASGSYRVVLNIWGDSNDPAAKDRTWLRFIRVRYGAEKTDWMRFHFKRTEPLKAGRYQEISYDFPNENLPVHQGHLVLGLGEGDQQIWISRVQVYHFAAQHPPEPE